MEIRVLRYFLEVAREGNITRAAGRLHVSQPTLSRQLKDLERELGKKLFERSNYSIRLTEEGMLLRKRAEDILDMVDKTTDEFKSLDEVSGGDVHIGCAESDGVHHIVAVARDIQRTHPRIRCHFYSSGTDAVSERIESGLLDFAIIVQQVDLSKYNYLQMPSQDRWGLLMRKDSPLAAKEAVRLDDVVDLPLICSRQGLREEMPHWFGESLDRLTIVATYDLLFNASVMAREGYGYVLGFDNLVDTGPESELCFRPLDPPLVSPMHVIWRKYQVFSPPAELLLNELKRRFAVNAFPGRV